MIKAALFTAATFFSVVAQADKLSDLTYTFQYDYTYQADGEDNSWRIMTADKEGKYRGDCEDFALTLLYELSHKDKKTFWSNLEERCEIRIYHMEGKDREEGVMHAALWDNEFKVLKESGQQRWIWEGQLPGKFVHKVSKQEMIAMGVNKSIVVAEIRELFKS